MGTKEKARLRSFGRAITEDQPEFYYNTKENYLTMMPDDEREELLATGEFIKIPKKKNYSISSKGFIRYISGAIDKFKVHTLEEFETYVKEHFISRSEDFYDIDHTAPKFSRKFNCFLEEFYEVRKEYNKYNSIIHNEFLMNFFEDHNIPYSMDNAWEGLHWPEAPDPEE